MWTTKQYQYPVREAFRFHFEEPPAAPLRHEETQRVRKIMDWDKPKYRGPGNSERTELDYQMEPDIVRKDAPYGNDDTQYVTMKIVGGRKEFFMEQPPKFNQGGGGGGSRIQILRPIADKPNHLDPRIHGDNPGGYYNKDVQNICCCQYECRCGKRELDDPTAHYNKRPDSKDVVRGQFKALPPIQQNRIVNSTSTVFQAEPWIGYNENPSLSKDTEYKQNYLTGRENEFDTYNQNGVGRHEPSVSDYERQQLLKIIPPHVLLPVDPIKLSREQELVLCKLICEELRDFNPKELKDVYVECSHWDKNLEGLCTLEVLDQKLRNHRANLSETLRPLAAQFVDPSRPGYINYEKSLSFIGSALKLKEKGQLSDDRHGKYYQQNTEPSKLVSMYTERELAKTLRMVEQELTKNSYSFNAQQWEFAFQRMDRDHRETLSAAQIKDICYDLKLPLSDSLINKILLHCESGIRDSQYKWDKFLKFLERLRPTNTGLPIPVSKRPLEYAKHYPEPVPSWPRAEAGEKRGTSPRRDYQSSPRRGDRSNDRGQSPVKQPTPSNGINGHDRNSYPNDRRKRDSDVSSPRGFNDRSPDPFRDRRFNSPEPHDRFNSPSRDKNGYPDRQERQNNSYPINGYNDYDKYEQKYQDRGRYNEPDRNRRSRFDGYNDRRRYPSDNEQRRSYGEDPRSYVPSWQQETQQYQSRSPPPQRRINERDSYRDDRKTDSYERHWKKWAYKNERYDRDRDTYRRDRQDSYRDGYRNGGDRTDRGDGTHRSRDEQINQLSHQIKDLEMKYQLTKDGLRSNEKPWKDRFILMAQALYNSDISNKGSLPMKDVQAIVDQYNSAFNLDLNMDRVRMMYILPENLDKSNNIILRSFLASLATAQNDYKP